MTNAVGRSSHICNGGFLVTEAARNRGVGRLMGEGGSPRRSDVFADSYLTPCRRLP